MINDISGFGRCSMTVALPVISIMQVQVCPVPTSIFSNHMGFPTWHFDDYTANMPSYLESWDTLGLHFDGIYSGFLGNENQISIIEDFIDRQKILSPAPLVIIDPVMGDNGRAYSSITESHCLKMKDFIRHADIITPNITEACLLTDTPYRESGWTSDSLSEIAGKLRSLGPKKLVITGIRGGSTISNYIIEGTSSYLCETPFCGQSRPGTGDLFASILAADALKGTSLLSSVEKAAGFVRLCIEESDRAGIPVREGVIFEKYLSRLL